MLGVFRGCLGGERVVGCGRHASANMADHKTISVKEMSPAAVDMLVREEEEGRNAV